MALINDILKKRNAASSFVPVNEQELAEQEKMVPVVQEMATDSQSNEQPAGNVQPNSTPISKYPNKPQGMTDEEYEGLKSYFSRENYDPSTGEGFYTRLYKYSNSKPAEPDEKKIRNAKIIGSIADSLGLLSQMWSYGKGAHVKERDYKDSASSRIAEQENNLRNIYLKQQSDYGKGLNDAKIKDYADYNARIKMIEERLMAKQKLKQEQARFDEKLKLERKKIAAEQEEKKRNYEIKEKQLKVAEAQGWARISDAKNRTTAYVKKMSSSDTGKKKDKYQMVFEANPNDKDAQTDSFGNKVKVFEMSKGEVDHYAREALSDPQFMARHPELILQKPERYGAGSYKYKPNQDIAAVYLREEYEKRFAPQPAYAPMRTPWMPDNSESAFPGEVIFDADGEAVGEFL